MSLISNIWNHPKTSASGLLLAILTIGGVLSQNGIGLGKAGSGTVVTLISAVATALLGLLARDPAAAPSSTGSVAKLGAWALIALLIPLPYMSGCSGTTVAQDIVNWTPALQSAVTTVDTTAALLAPVDAPLFAAATAGFDAASKLLANQARAYLANPSAGLLAEIQAQIVTFQQQVNAALLSVARITNPASQKHALSAIQATATIVSAIFSLVQSISGKAALAQMAAHSTIKLASAEPLLDSALASQMIADHYREPVAVASAEVAQAEQWQKLAGF
jgi:hypothetical protein